MVMETPSPQCVGREFVRQYYTLMHEAPKQLHRFYSDASSFVHGGVEKPGEEQPPYMGQEGIHAKIMSLKLNDCRAKIRQVDSQSTVGDAVVVQVTGELSNNGQPMRRFMQTFVLALQSPKKYYVHNDIFRYQDEVFYDNDSDENQEECLDSEPEIIETPIEEPQPVQDPNITSYHESAEPAQPPLSNGDVHMPEREPSPQPEEPLEKEIEEPEPEPYIPEPEPEPPVVEQPVEQKPCSWAAMASKNSAAGSQAPPPAVAAPVAVKAIPPVKDAPQQQRPPRAARDRTSAPRIEPERPAPGGRGEEGDFEGNRSRSMRYPDSHQLFVGNLPQDVTEKELKTFFEGYGKVVELRINTKSGGGRVPNFGFVVFEDPGPVQKVLSEKPIRIRNDHRLNVEEKKARGDGGGRPGSASRQGRGGGPSDRGGRGGPPPGDRKRGGFGSRPDAGRGSGRGGNANSGGFSGPRR